MTRKQAQKSGPRVPAPELTAPESGTPESGIDESSTVASIAAELSPGELIDRITILEIKSQRITAPGPLENIGRELSAMCRARDGAVPASADLDELTAGLAAVNRTLWDIEDDIRACEREQDFGPRFVALARGVYRHNDRRAALKRDIDDLLGAAFTDEKSYAVY